MIEIIKIGGAKDVAISAILDDVAELVSAGRQVVVVHGASEEIRHLAERLDVPPRYFTSPTGMKSRHTDPAALEVVLMAFGRVNMRIVRSLLQKSVRAVGLTGMDGAVAVGRRKSALRAVEGSRTHIVRDDFSAKITGVRADLIRTLVVNGFTPVISPPALDPVDGPVNVDADRLAASIAGALVPSRLCLLTNVRGVLREAADPSSLVTHVDPEDDGAFLQLAQGRMKLKILAARDAVRAGVSEVVISDSRQQRPVFAALAHSGTVFRGIGRAGPAVRLGATP